MSGYQRTQNKATCVKKYGWMKWDRIFLQIGLCKSATFLQLAAENNKKIQDFCRIPNSRQTVLYKQWLELVFSSLAFFSFLFPLSDLFFSHKKSKSWLYTPKLYTHFWTLFFLYRSCFYIYWFVKSMPLILKSALLAKPPVIFISKTTIQIL